MDDLRTLDHVRRLRHELPPGGLLGMARIDCDYAPARCGVIGLEVKHGSIVAKKAIGRVEVIEQTDDRRVQPRMLGIAQVLVVDAIRRSVPSQTVYTA